MLDVMITIDTEVWPKSPGWPHVPLDPAARCERELDAYFYGGGESGLGLPYQLRVFRDAGLKAIFFVEALFSFALGTEPLRKVLRLIAAHDQEVGLHLHPEWLTDSRCVGLPAFRGPFMHQYSEQDQTTLLLAGARRLRELGAPQVRSFRAGSWGAASTTLRAVARAGIEIDCSLNSTFPTSFPDLAERDDLCQPAVREGIWEFPVSTFIDRPPSGRRPLHVCACSFGEFSTILEQADRLGWSHIVIVLHSFEFMRVNNISTGRGGPHRLLAARFERLCGYLAANTARFRTCHLSDVDLASLRPPKSVAPLISSHARTIRRYAEQAFSRIY
jgi:peptidoglycan/xylan/chitin deacetylase (PgdA/CDA1 family)